MEEEEEEEVEEEEYTQMEMGYFTLRPSYPPPPQEVSSISHLIAGWMDLRTVWRQWRSYDCEDQ
jgi:hypothetical protein